MVLWVRLVRLGQDRGPEAAAFAVGLFSERWPSCSVTELTGVGVGGRPRPQLSALTSDSLPPFATHRLKMDHMKIDLLRAALTTLFSGLLLQNSAMCADIVVKKPSHELVMVTGHAIHNAIDKIYIVK